MENIRKKVRELKSRCKTEDVYEIAKSSGIKIYYCKFKNLRGMYAVILKTRCIFINESLSDEEKRMTLAHEMGHDFLHREFAKNSYLQDKMIIDMKLKPEYEANLFAADILISDDEISEISRAGYDIYEAGKMLGVDENMVSLKLRLMNLSGGKFNETAYNPDFIK